MSAAVTPMPAAGLRAWWPLLRSLLDAFSARREGQKAGRDVRAEVLALAPATLQRLAARFDLGEVEAATLALCAGAEWDAAMAQACAAWHGEAARAWPSYGQAIALFADGDWTALAPDVPARRWRLVDVAPGLGIAQARLSADERILNYLADRSFLDPRLDGLIRPARESGAPPDDVSRRIAARWSALRSATDCPLADLSEYPSDHALRIAAATCELLGLRLHTLQARDIPATPAEREALARLWEREASLVNGALLIDCNDADPPGRTGLFFETVQGLVFASGDLPPLRRLRLRCTAPLHDAVGVAPWLEALGPFEAGDHARLGAVAAQFRLTPDGVRQVAAQVHQRATESGADVPALVWEACREQVRGGLDALAQRIEAKVGWDDLVLPAPQMTTLRTMAMHVRERHRVYREWGFDAKGNRGLGIAALFSGPSGTGKTLAAEVLAHELRLDLYRVDLSAMVSKYVGETQKNLRRVFDAAEAGGAILLFDEADALFSARGEVRDSLDRHSNMEIAYLLQRVETYRGLAILTTNMKQAIDPAFVRRIRFIVNFPFPDLQARGQIWRRVFPAQMPSEGLDIERLARLNLSGGNIRSVALNAAFLAAGEVQPVTMRHLLGAAEAEYAKLEKPLPRAEVGDW